MMKVSLVESIFVYAFTLSPKLKIFKMDLEIIWSESGDDFVIVEKNI